MKGVLLSPCHKSMVYIFQDGKEAAPIMCCSRGDNEWDVDGELIEREVTGL